MPVDIEHPQYTANASQWQKLRDVDSGERAIKAGGATYLPRPVDRTDEEFESYLRRALFYNATGRTVTGLVGAIFRKPPQADFPTALEYMEEDADGRGTPISSLAQRVAREVFITGRCGLLVDFPQVPPGATKADEDALGAQSRIYSYEAENIINWRYERVGSRWRLTLVVLKEEVSTPAADGFGEDSVEQYRVLKLEDGYYVVEIWRPDENNQAPIEPPYWPALPGGKRLAHIPFVFVNADDLTANVCESPISDLAEVNLAHYRNSADYEEALYMTGQPTPYITGLSQKFIDDNRGALRVGSRAAWLLPANADAGLLEVRSDLAALRGALEDKRAMMVEIGARLVEKQAGGVEAAETKRIRQSGDASVLETIAGNVEMAFNMALAWAGEWMKAAGEPVFSLNDDFFVASMGADDLKALLAALQGGSITFETYFNRLRDGEIIDHDETVDEYREKLDEEKASNMPAPDLSDEAIEDEEEEPDEEDDEDDDEAQAGMEGQP